MLTSDLIGTSLTGLKRQKIRSLLTALGVIIGVGSVVLMISIGSSFQNYILSQLDQFGGNVFEIHAKGLQEMGKETLTITFDDYEALSRLSTVTSVAPVIFVTQPVSYGDKDLNPFVFGTTKELLENWSMTTDKGRLLDDGDVNAARNIAVLGSKAAEDLFPNEDPIGKRITVGERKFTVVGVLKSLGSPLAASMDTPVYIPLTVAKSMMGRDRYIDYISLQSIVDTELAQLDIESVLRQRHQIDNPENDPKKDDFIARSVEQAASVIGSVTLGITIFLGLIAGISLIVGGIGIMNIMLVSVTERTREIGLRKAVGARKRDILWQFLLEAVVLTVIGGVIGIIVAITFGFLLSLIAKALLGSFEFFLPMSAIILAVGMAVGTGLIFGLYPARRAANLSPMEAMRWE